MLSVTITWDDIKTLIDSNPDFPYDYIDNWDTNQRVISVRQSESFVYNCVMKITQTSTGYTDQYDFDQNYASNSTRFPNDAQNVILIPSSTGNKVIVVSSTGYALDVDENGNISSEIAVNGANIDPRQIRALTASDVVSASQDGTWDINDISGTVSLPTGAATSANQTTTHSKLDTLHTDLNTTIHGDLDSIELDIESTNTKLDTVNTNLTTIDTDIKAQQPRKLYDKDGNGITSKDEGSSIQSLDVNIRSGSVNSLPSGNSIRYDKMTSDQAIGNGSWTTIYSYSGSGILYFIQMHFTEDNTDIRFKIDSTIIADTFNLNDLGANYTLSLASITPMLPPWIYVWESNTSIAIQLGTTGATFSSSILVEAKVYLNNKKLTRGLVVRSI